MPEGKKLPKILGVYGRIILKEILNVYSVRMCAGIDMFRAGVEGGLLRKHKIFIQK
jgi:hypothetical protein